MFLLIHHLTFPRDSYSNLISSQWSHRTLETSTEVQEKADSAAKNLTVTALSFFISFCFSSPQIGPKRAFILLHTYTRVAICCVKRAGGVWWGNCARLKSDILFENYFSERELKIDEIWHLHKPWEKKVISKTNFPGVQVRLTRSQPVITSRWNYSLIGKKKYIFFFFVKQ